MQSREIIESKQLASVASSFLRVRPLILLPAAPVLAAAMLSANTPRVQMACIGGNVLVMLSFFFWEARRQRTKPVTIESFGRSLLWTVAGIASVCGFSGGLRSPFLPILFAPVGIAFAALGRGPSTTRVVVTMLLALCYVACAPLFLPWPQFPALESSVMSFVAVLLTTTLLFFGVTGLSAAYRKTAEQLEQTRHDVIGVAASRNKELQSLGGRVAHELKNPLASIKALVQLVHDRALKQHEGQAQENRSAERLSVVLSEVERMDGILRDYAALTRPLSDLDPREHRLDSFLREFATLIEGQAQQRGVRVNVMAPKAQTHFDAMRLKQALLNLAQNALYAMPSGGTLQLEARETERSFEVVLGDTGPGMTKEDLAQLGVAFFSKREDGTGLGIAIATMIVEQHGGALSFESEVGVGTRATLTLPKLRSGVAA